MGMAFGRVLAVLLLVAVAAGIGTWVYNAGVSAGLAEAAVQAAASGDPVPYVGWGPGYGPYAHGPWGFGFFGILFGILFLFLVFGLVRAAFGGGWRGGGPGGWKGRREMLEEMHRDLHRRDADTTGTQASGA